MKWLSISSAVSVAAAVLGLFVLGAGAGLIVGVVSVVLGVLFADWAAQELTVPQRLWIHRGVFGRHEVNYRDSEPFGGQMSEQAHAYFDCQTNKLCINQPYGGVPSSESEEAYKAYQLKALTEEKLALGMLVRGITLSINVKIIPSSYVAATGGIFVYAHIVLTIPEKIDGIIRLELSKKTTIEKDIIYAENSSFVLLYQKIGDSISLIDKKGWNVKPPEFKKEEKTFVLDFSSDVEKSPVNNDVTFEFSSIEKEFIPIARDKFSIKY